MSDVKELEYQLENTKKMSDRRDQVERLCDNADFRDVILNSFCRDDAARYIQESCDPLLTAEQRADALAMAQASGHLKRFLQMQIRMGEVATRNVSELEEALTEARAEEGNL